MKNFLKNRQDRRKFFSIAGKGSLGMLLLSSLPFKIFAATPKYRKLKKVKIHPQAIKRTK